MPLRLQIEGLRVFMADSGRVGIAKVAIRGQEYLAVVKADGLFLMLELDSLASDWEPTRYKYRYQKTVKEMIKAKIAALPMTKRETASVSKMTKDIVSILQRSLEESAKLSARGALVREAVLRNLKIADGLGLLTPKNRDAMRRGHLPAWTTSRGPSSLITSGLQSAPLAVEQLGPTH